jgi:hypothetical protein
MKIVSLMVDLYWLVIHKPWCETVLNHVTSFLHPYFQFKIKYTKVYLNCIKKFSFFFLLGRYQVDWMKNVAPKYSQHLKKLCTIWVFVWLQLQNKFVPKKSSFQISEYTKTSKQFWMNNVQTENTYLLYSPSSS